MSHKISKTSLTVFVLRLFVTSCILTNNFGACGFTNTCGDVKSYKSSSESSFQIEDDADVQESFSSFKDRLTDILENQHHLNHGPRVASAPPTPCLDLTSGQSVITQLCDKITRLENRLALIETDHKQYSGTANSKRYSHNDRSEPRTSDNHPSEHYPHNHPVRNEEALSANLNFLQKEVEKLQKNCAFHASRIDSVSQEQSEVRLTGFKASVNLGEGFSAENGTFEVPWDGVYYFTLSFLKSSEVFPLSVSLVIDHVTRARGSDEQQAFVNFMTSLHRGQKVWPAITTQASSSGVDVTFTFSGFLVK